MLDICLSNNIVLRGRGFCTSSIAQITGNVPKLLADIVDTIKKTSFVHSFFKRIPKCFRTSIFLDFSDFEPRIILKLFLNTKGVVSPKILMNIFQSRLMFYYIIKACKSLYFVWMKQKYI